MTIMIRPRPEVGSCQRVFTTAWQLAGLLVGIKSYYQVHDGTYLAWNGVGKLWQSPEFTFEANIYQFFKSVEQIIFRRCSSSDWRPSCGAKFPVQFLAPDGSLTVDFVLIYSNMLMKYILIYQNKFFSSKEDQEHLTVCEGTKISEEMPTSRTRKNWLTSPTA